MKPSTLERWFLSMHICSQLSQDVYNLTDENESKDVRYHKEEGPGHIKAIVLTETKYVISLIFAIGTTTCLSLKVNGRTASTVQ